MIEHTEDMRLGVGQATCPAGNYYLTVKIERGCSSSAAMIRPASGLRFGLLIVFRSLRALCFKK